MSMREKFIDLLFHKLAEQISKDFIAEMAYTAKVGHGLGKEDFAVLLNPLAFKTIALQLLVEEFKDKPSDIFDVEEASMGYKFTPGEDDSAFTISITRITREIK